MHSGDYNQPDNPYSKAKEYGAGLKARTGKDITGRLATFEDLAPFGVTTSLTSSGSITSDVLKKINGLNAAWWLGAAESYYFVWNVDGINGRLNVGGHDRSYAVRPVIEILESDL